MTVSNIDKIKTAMAGTSRKIKEKEIWKGLEKMYSPQIADFTWRMIHGRVKCGPFFRHIPNWQEKEFCSCGASESIEHILVLCEESGQQELWNLVGEKWRQETGLVMGDMNIGTIMGAGTLEVDDLQGEVKKPATDLLRKLIALTSWVIWKERNHRIFNEREMLPQRLLTRWTKEVRREIKIYLWEKANTKRMRAGRMMWTINGTFAEMRR